MNSIQDYNRKIVIIKILLVVCALTVSVAFAFSASGLSARYSSAGTGSDNARVAKWDVQIDIAEPDENGRSIISNGDSVTGSYKVSVTNRSETAAAVSLRFEGVPVGMVIHVNDGTKESKYDQKTNAVVIVNNNGTGWVIDSNGGQKEFIVRFSAYKGTSSNRFNININTIVDQID
ncbi:MAG: hypothetical protein Q4D40_03900 [Eubacteriales bacterium]|nr:hypothetical protein [Eubacteriales bacterium]